MNYKRILISVKKENTRNLKGHDSNKELGTRFLLCDRSLFKDSRFYMALRLFNEINNIKEEKQHVLNHKHKVDSYWFFGGNKKDLKGLKIKIVIGGVEKILESPISVYIPRNIPHYYIPIKGSGFYLNLVLTGKKKYNDVTISEFTNNDRKKTRSDT